MSNIGELLQLSNNGNNENMEYAYNQLNDRIRTNPINLIFELVEFLNSQNPSEKLIFTAFTLINRCYKRVIIPKSLDNQIDRDRLPEEYSTSLLEFSMRFFSNTTDEIRRQAVLLFSQISKTKFYQFAEMRMIDRLIEMIQDEDNQKVISVFNVLTFIFENIQLEDEYIYNLFNFTLPIYLNHTSTEIITSCLEFFSHLDVQISQFFADQNTYAIFLKRTIDLLHERDAGLQQALIMYILSSMKSDLNIFNEIGQTILELINTLLCNEETPRENILNLCFFVEKAIGIQNEEINILIAEQLLETFIYVMQRIDTSIEMSDTEWEPSSAAYSVVRTLIIEVPDCIESTLYAFIIRSIISDTPETCETALKLLKIFIFHIQNIEHSIQLLNEGVLQELANRIADPDHRVRCCAIGCINVISEKVGISVISSLVESLFSIIENDNDTIVQLILKELEKLSRQSDFLVCFPDFLIRLNNIIHDVSPNLLPDAIQCFRYAIKHQSDLLNCLQYLLSLISKVLSTENMNNHTFVIESIFHTMALMIINSNIDISELFDPIVQIAFIEYEQHSICFALLAISYFSNSYSSLIAPHARHLILDLNECISKIGNDQTQFLEGIVAAIPMFWISLDLDEDLYVILIQIATAIYKTNDINLMSSCIVAFNLMIPLVHEKVAPYLQWFLKLISFTSYYIPYFLDLHGSCCHEFLIAFLELLKHLVIYYSQQEPVALFNTCINTINILALKETDFVQHSYMALFNLYESLRTIYSEQIRLLIESEKGRPFKHAIMNLESIMEEARLENQVDNE